MSPHYDVSGHFYEACDCEIVCSCWAEVPPAMGQCTGLWVWEVTGGKIDGVDVGHTRLALMTHGETCDLADAMLVAIDAGPDPQGARFTALERALAIGSWSEVVTVALGGFKGAARPATIEITHPATGMTRVTVQLISASGEKTPERAIANMRFLGLDMVQVGAGPKADEGDGKGPLLARVTGDKRHQVEIGRVELMNVDAAYARAPVGLDLLATLGDPDPAKAPRFEFDLDVTTVTAMRGDFRYRHG